MAVMPRVSDDWTVDDLEQLLDDGTVSHPYLGLSLGRVTPAIREQLHLSADHGALVLAVDQDGPAASTGARAGDVVVRFAEREVASVEDVLAQLRKVDPDDRVTLTVVRDGQQQKLDVTIGERSG